MTPTQLPQLVDIAVNFHSAQLQGRHAQLLARARAAGVARVVAVGTSIESSQRALELAHEHRGTVYATAGLHPNTPGLELCDEHALAGLRALWAQPQVLAVGECGLDYCRTTNPPDVQRRVFAAQLEAALGVGKPLYLHCRDAFEDFHALLQPFAAKGATGVVHCFTGDLQQARAFLDLGLDLGITGWVADERRGQALRDALPHLPLSRLHLETDAPYLSIRTLKGRRPYNEPANVLAVAQAVAQLTGLPVADVAAQCTRNSERLFGLPASHA